MFVSLRKILVNLIAGVNLGVLFLLFSCVFSTYLSPESFPRVGLLGLVFPIFLVINLLFILFWLVFYVRFVWIPLVGLLLCFPFVRDYFPLNWPVEPPEGSLKVLSYNSAGIGYHSDNSEEYKSVADYILTHNADIVCIQEGNHTTSKSRIHLDKVMKGAGYHAACVEGERWDMIPCYSKYPILSAEALPYASLYNASVKYRILVGRDTLVVVNNHLESYKLTADDKAQYKDIIREPDREGVEQGARMLVNKMAEAVKLRGPQVDSLLVQLAPSNHLPTILCGDFNDSPISYTYRRFTDVYSSAFEDSGCGAGISFNQKGFSVRIDHIFYSRHWESYDTYVDCNISSSDHYPLITHLKRVEK